MAPSSRHLYPAWLFPERLRPRNGWSGTPAVSTQQRPDEGAWRVWEWLRAFDRRYATLVDVVLAGGLFVLCSGWFIERSASRPSLWLVAALIFPLTFRRRAPMTVFLVIAAVALLQWFVAERGLADVALLVALYTVALESEWRLVAAAVVILEVGVVLATARWELTGNNVQSFVFLTGLVFTALLAGVVVRALGSQLDWLAERAERLEIERDQQASLAAVTERARIAREMHDVVSHNIQVMVTLADAASLAQAANPERAAEAIHEVSSTGRQALTDMRRMLGVLRDEPPAGAGAGPGDPIKGNGSGGGNVRGRPSLAPQPGLRELRCARRARPGHRPRHLGRTRRFPLRAVRCGRSDRLPGGAGGAHQCPEACPRADQCGGAPGLRRSGRVGAGHRQRQRERERHRQRARQRQRPLGGTGRGPRPGRHGGAGHGFRRDPQCRATRCRRLGGRGHVARLQGALPRMTIRVVLADDQALLRKGFRMILEAEEDMEIVGEAPDGADAVRLVELYRPDVVLMDVRMPVLDGIEATRAIAASSAGTETRVLILTTFDLDEYAFSALRAGASGFLLKDVPPAELIAAIRTVARGDAVVSPRITRRLLEEYAATLPDLSAGAGGADGGAGADEHPALASLTEREREVLLAVADGLSNAEIAERLYVSEATVKSHVGRLLAKLGLRDRVQAVVFAFQSGLVRP